MVQALALKSSVGSKRTPATTEVHFLGKWNQWLLPGDLGNLHGGFPGSPNTCMTIVL